jgi:hypothetical protein
MSDKYLRLALSEYWQENPADVGIPFIGLSTSGQYSVRAKAVLMQLEEERESLRQVVDYQPVK